MCVCAVGSGMVPAAIMRRALQAGAAAGAIGGDEEAREQRCGPSVRHLELGSILTTYIVSASRVHPASPGRSQTRRGSRSFLDFCGNEETVRVRRHEWIRALGHNDDAVFVRTDARSQNEGDSATFSFSSQ